MTTTGTTSSSLLQWNRDDEDDEEDDYEEEEEEEQSASQVLHGNLDNEEDGDDEEEEDEDDRPATLFGRPSLSSSSFRIHTDKKTEGRGSAETATEAEIYEEDDDDDDDEPSQEDNDYIEEDELDNDEDDPEDQEDAIGQKTKEKLPRSSYPGGGGSGGWRRRSLPKQQKLSQHDDTSSSNKRPKTMSSVWPSSSSSPCFSKPPLYLAFAYLQGHAWHPTKSSLSGSARTLLQSLLKDEHFLPWDDDEENTTKSRTEKVLSAALDLVSQQQQQQTNQVVVVHSGLPDSGIVELTREPRREGRQRLSYLQSFLSVLQEEMQNGSSGGVPARVLLKRCCLTIAPSRVPAALDAEEMAMAALEFLSSTFQPSSSVVPSPPKLPLIRPVKEENDIKKRCYVPVGTWQLDDPIFVAAMNVLEDWFFHDVTSYKWLRRGVFLPSTSGTLANEERDLLLRKGKHKLVSTAPKKKQQQPQPSSSTPISMFSPINTTPNTTARQFAGTQRGEGRGGRGKSPVTIGFVPGTARIPIKSSEDPSATVPRVQPFASVQSGGQWDTRLSLVGQAQGQQEQDEDEEEEVDDDEEDDHDETLTSAVGSSHDAF